MPKKRRRDQSDVVLFRAVDGVARLLGLAMVGTAAAFNLQAHTAFATVDSVAPELHAIVPIHWVLHAVSGAAYLHALLVFPTGKVGPARLGWLVRLAYVFMVEEILRRADGSGMGS